jgi:HEAT repeat protein
MVTNNKIPVQQLLDALLNEDTPFHPKYLYRLSDLDVENVQQLKEIWPRVSVRRRQALLEDVEELGEQDTLQNFEELGRIALKDSDPLVRTIAVRMLWDYEERDLVPVFLGMMISDDSVDVRAAAASALGKYVYLGEIEEIPARMLHRVEEGLLKVTEGSDAPLVRRRALEALGFSSREEVRPLIEDAYRSEDVDWQVTAIFAMGRSADQEQWSGPILAELDSAHPAIRAEAARAAGELEISEATSALIDMLEDDDDDVRMASVWSLSQIGGEGVREILEQMQEEAEDDEEIELLEDALENLSFTDEMALFSLIDISDSTAGDEVDDDDLEEDFDLISNDGFDEDEDSVG